MAISHMTALWFSNHLLSSAADAGRARGDERVCEEGSDKSARPVREDHHTENDRVHQSAQSSKEALENAPGPSRTSARLGVSITQSLQITAASLSGCIVQSNFRCASCVLKHLLLRYVKRSAAFHGKIFRQSLQRFREARDYFYPADLICHFYLKKHLECFSVDERKSVEWRNVNVSFYELKRF